MLRSGLVSVLVAFGLGIMVVPGHAVTIEVGSGQGAAGATVSVPTTLRTMGANVRGVINELAVTSSVPIVGCTVNPIFSSTGVVNLQPENCQAGVSCLSARAVLTQFSNNNIPDGTVLYSCDFKIAEGVTGSQAITCSNSEASDPNGQALAVACTNGSISVGNAVCAGDCDQDGEVFGNEVTVAINIVAGNADLAMCQNADADGDGEVFGNEVTIAINNVANGCPQ